MYTKEENEKAGPADVRENTNLHFVLENINSPVADPRCQFATVLLKKRSC